MATTAVWWLAGLGLIVVAFRWGARLQEIEPDIRLGAAPLVGQDKTDGWMWRFDRQLWSAGGVALIVASAVTRAWWWRWPRSAVVAFTSVAAAGFAVLLALADGVEGHDELLRGADHPTEYLANLDRAPPAAAFVRGFVEDIDRYTVHVRGHPPGFILVLKALDRVGLDGPWPVVGLSVLGTALVPVAVLAAVAALGGDHWVRRCAPLLAVSPYALWQMTSADAFFSAVGAGGVACCIVGVSGGRRAWWWGAAGGALLAGLLFLTYGGALFLLVPGVPVALALWRRSAPAGAVAAGAVGAALVVTAAFAIAGFWWFAGATETERQYWAGTARLRPAEYFALANVAVALIAIGPGGFAGLTALWRSRRLAPPMAALTVGALLAVAASNLSQLTKGEVERIWLLFYPWLVVSGGLVVTEERRWRAAALVSLQAACGVILQAVLVSKW